MENEPRYLGKDARAWAALLTEGDPVLRRLAVFALGEIGAAGHDVAPALDIGLRDEVNWVRVWAAAALARATGERRAVDVLVAEMAAPEAFVRSLVAWHIGRLGSEFAGIEDGIEAVQRLVEDPDRNVRTEAILALQRLQSRGMPPSGAIFPLAVRQ
ncbi:MAG: HEAT repeat domain-containing protein [Thiohalocapsa sp.]